MTVYVMETVELPEYIQFLMNTNAYPYHVDEVGLIQTHISFIVVAGNFVYKWKKPVDLGFLNFSTLRRRHYYCNQELLLNRRLCRDIYLELVVLTHDSESYRFRGRGRVIEYGVKMVRLPEERMMNRLIGHGVIRKEDINSIVARLVPFYERSDFSERIARFGSAREVGRNVRENFRQTDSFVGVKELDRNRFKRIEAFSTHFLSNERVFRQRIKEGRIRDCHGDLHTANICLTKDVVIFDCIEFSRRLRYTDIAADIAFLAMDLDFHGLHKLSCYFIEQFVLATGDQGLYSVLNFYKCYRAYVRGKINLLTAVDATVNRSVAEHCRERAGAYFALAESYAGQVD